MSVKENCKNVVLQYLRNQNRPYSANDVMQNLHNEFGKTAIQKALDDLTLETKIKEKIYGKQKIYSVVQEEETNAEDLALELVSLDCKIEEISEKLRVAEQEFKKAETEIKELENAPSTARALQEKEELERDLEKLNERIMNLSKNSPGITEAEKKKISKEHETYKKEYRKRKQICMDVLHSIMENYPKKIKALFEEIGIEED